MSVGKILEATNPVYINHMIVLAAVDSSSLAYWLPSLLNAQCELHYFALVFSQLILECHWASLALPGGLRRCLASSDPRFLRLIQQGKGPWLKKGEASSF